MTKRSVTALVALGLALLAPAAFAQGADPEVTKLFGEVAQAYRNLTSCSFTIDRVVGSGPQAHKITSKICLKKPDAVAAEIQKAQTVLHLVADGKTAYADSSDDRETYTAQPAANLTEEIAFVAEHGGAGLGTLQTLLTSEHAESQLIPGNPTSVKRAADAMVGSDSCDVIDALLILGTRSSVFELAFGKQDHLLRKESLGPADASAPRQIVVTYSNIDLHPTLVASTFKFTPQPGAKLAGGLPEQHLYDPRIKAGAAPLPIGGADLAGKTVSLSQFKGKVLLLDFWATWCVPCVAELPNVIATYEKYHAKGFEIVGISLDLENARDTIEKFIADKKMPWQQIYDGKHWNADNAVAYGVLSIPFTVLIGRDGKVAAVSARGPALAPAVEAALAQK